MIPNDTNILCPWCECKCTLKDWNENTYKECKSREMRRKYTQLNNEKAFKRKTDTYYKCPVCGKWLRGSQLVIVDTEDARLLRLGREPVVKVK